jgi:hypothetical protein
MLRDLGPRLDAVPRDETIALAVEFFDDNGRYWRQLVVQTRAATTDDPNTYSVWLDGRPYDFAQMADQVPPSGADTTTGTTLAWDFADPQVAADEWRPVSGDWVIAPGAYEQTRLDEFDFLSFLSKSMASAYWMQADMSFVSGRMGGGLVFNAPTRTTKQGAQMVSYSEAGSLLQCGYFDATGVFQFQGGAEVPSGADGHLHKLEIVVSARAYSVVLDGFSVFRDVPLARPDAGGYVGLLASTSHVRFHRVAVRDTSLQS